MSDVLHEHSVWNQPAGLCATNCWANCGICTICSSSTCCCHSKRPECNQHQVGNASNTPRQVHRDIFSMAYTWPPSKLRNMSREAEQLRQVLRLHSRPQKASINRWTKTARDFYYLLTAGPDPTETMEVKGCVKLCHNREEFRAVSPEVGRIPEMTHSHKCNCYHGPNLSPRPGNNMNGKMTKTRF